jgi:adenylate cyclase
MKKLLSPWMALVTLVLLLAIRVADPAFVESVRLRYFDQLITSKGATTSEQVHVVNIDDAYIRQKGQFPFPRGQYAKLVSDLYSHGAGLVVFNIYMPESDRFAQDNQLTQLMKQVPVVIPQVAVSEEVESKYAPFRPGVSVIGGENAGVRYESIIPNIKEFNSNAAGIGVVNTLPEIDGVTRRVPMVVQSRDRLRVSDAKVAESSGYRLYPSISLETLRVASGDPSFQVKVNEGNIEAVRIPKFGKITTDELGRIWVDWSKRPVEHSASSLPASFNGGIVIVGLTAKGLTNPVAASVGSVYPHYLQAAVLDTVTSGTNISRPDWALIAELAFMIVAVILSIYLTRFTHGYVFALVLGAVAYYGGFQLFMGHGYLLDAVFPILTIFIASFHGYIVKFLVELRAKLQIKKQFGGYVSPIIVNQLAEDPEGAAERLKGEKRDLSIVMTDLRGFTTLGESFGADVQGLTAVMNRYMDALSKPVLKNGGCIIKFIGDASLHVHNAPVDDKDHAVTAVKTALEMIQAIEEFNKELQAEGRPPVGMGAGVNTGPTLIGNIGANERYGYDVLGDSVSTAARLEGQTKGYGVLLIIGPETNKLIQDEYATLELDCIAVKGKTVGLNIYAVVGRHAELMKTTAYVPETHAHEKMLELYRIKKFDMAIKMCNELKGSFKGFMDDYYEIWIERCEEMKTKDLPADWDGVYRATSK